MSSHSSDSSSGKGDTVAVVGLGYVGITLACVCASKYRMVGIDIDKGKVRAINAGELPLKGVEPGLEGMLRDAVREKRLRAYDDYGPCRTARYVMLCIDTPVDRSRRIDARHLLAAVASIGRHLSPDTTVIVESTVAPTTTDRLIVPTLERNSKLKAGKDFYVAHAPERVMPGRLLTNINSYERIVGGIDPESTKRALEFYSSILTVKLHPTDAITAEIVKTAENTYRDVQIAFANEVALLCEEYGADVFKVRELVNNCPFRDMHLPGGGVGGHCLPKDPWLLISNSNQKKGLIATARRINDSMPVHVAGLVVKALEKVAGDNKKGARIVTILGASYLANSGDMRNSPSLALRDVLSKRGFEVRLHDPFAEHEGVSSNLEDCVSGSDCIVLMVDHAEYRKIDLRSIARSMRTRTLVDAKGFFAGSKWVSEFYYIGLGKGVRKGK